MLARLLKYEIKSTARIFLPLYGAIIILATLNRVFNTSAIFNQVKTVNTVVILQVISMITYFILLVGMMVLTLVVLIRRFYENLLGNEGYLMFTLPVHQWQHIANKLLTTVIWTILSMIAATGSVCILSGTNIFKHMPEFFRNISEYLGNSAFVWLPILLLSILIYGILMIYTAIALGHLFSKHKLLISFGMYLALGFVNQFVIYMYTYFIPISITNHINATNISLLAWMSIFLLFVLIAAYFFLTNYILKRRLNLE